MFILKLTNNQKRSLSNNILISPFPHRINAYCLTISNLSKLNINSTVLFISRIHHLSINFGNSFTNLSGANCKAGAHIICSLKVNLTGGLDREIQHNFRFFFRHKSHHNHDYSYARN